MFSMIPKTLIVYSNPDATTRLRLDKEHREMDRVLSKHSLPESIVKRIHAATMLDIGAALRDKDYEVLFFSGHGNQSGIVLDSDSRDPVGVTWSQLATLVRQAAPNLSVVVLNSCHSASSSDHMLKAAPFLITIDGTADDDAAIAFSANFVDEFYRSTSVDQAFRFAVFAVETMGKADVLKPLLLRRPTIGSAIIEAIFSRRQDSIRIDVQEAEPTISSLPMPRHDFLSLLSRKIRVHQWIFRSPRERAILPIGSFFGVFSWQNSNDVVKCHEVLQLRSDLDHGVCLGWTRLLVIYNDLRSDRYRSLQNPADPENKSILAQMLSAVETCYTHTLNGDDVKPVAVKLAPQLFAMTAATVRVHCDRARQNMEEGFLADTVASIEIAISAIHTLVDDLTSRVTVGNNSLPNKVVVLTGAPLRDLPAAHP